MIRSLMLTCCLGLTAFSSLPAAERSLYDGKSFAGWEGETSKTWRIENGVIVGGTIDQTNPRNEFLATTSRFQNFDLRLKYQLEGTEGFINGGVQFRTERIPDHHEVIGYQADIGMGYDGALYDESRRKKMLQQPDKEVLQKALKPGEWNELRIRAEGPHVQIWLNGIQTVDYTEQDSTVPQTGVIALQIHGNCKAIVRFKDIVIEELK